MKFIPTQLQATHYQLDLENKPYRRGAERNDQLVKDIADFNPAFYKTENLFKKKNYLAEHSTQQKRLIDKLEFRFPTSTKPEQASTHQSIYPPTLDDSGYRHFVTLPPDLVPLTDRFTPLEQFKD